jgi:hypothetical protein
MMFPDPGNDEPDTEIEGLVLVWEDENAWSEVYSSDARLPHFFRRPSQS